MLIEHSIFRDSHFGNAIRVECDAKGVAASNVFEKSSSSYVGIFLNTGSTTWNIENNKCDTTLKVVRAWAGSHTLRNNDFGSGTVEVRGDDHLFENNKLKNLFIDFTGSTDSRFTGNSIVGVFTGSAYPYEQIWINNYGSGAHAESGSAVLVAGTVTVNSAIIPSGAKISLTRQSASGTVGHLSIGTIAAGASFEINSSEPADTSTVFWRIEY